MIRATVFGVDVWADRPLAYLSGSTAPATGRSLDLTLVQHGAGERDWPAEAELIGVHRLPGGDIGFRIEADPEAGYLLAGPEYGSHVISANALRLRCFPGGAREQNWQRFLIAQVLPFAAALNGLEVLHASAVVIDGRALALLGPSGAGKTSLALALCRLGAGFLADDVLALERAEGQLIAHPGTPVAGVDHAEAERLPGAIAPSQTLAVDARERMVRVPGRGEPALLSALLFLHHDPHGPVEPRFAPVTDARQLLASTFNFVLDDAVRLSGLLEVCALAAQGRVERVLAGPAVDSTRLAEAVMERFAWPE